MESERPSEERVACAGSGRLWKFMDLKIFEQFFLARFSLNKKEILQVFIMQKFQLFDLLSHCRIANLTSHSPSRFKQKFYILKEENSEVFSGLDSLKTL